VAAVALTPVTLTWEMTGAPALAAAGALALEPGLGAAAAGALPAGLEPAAGVDLAEEAAGEAGAGLGAGAGAGAGAALMV
jgi:hypothetical protein